MKVVPYDNLVISLGYEQLIGIEGFDKRERVEKEIEAYNLFAILETCSKISTTLINKGEFNQLAQAELLSGLYTDVPTRTKYYETAKKISEGNTWVIFNNQSLLILIKIALLKCPQEGGKNMPVEDLHKLGNWLLMLNDLIFEKESSLIKLTVPRERERLREAIMRYFFHRSQERFGYRLGRYEWLVDYLVKNKPDGIDIEKLFQEATDIPLETYRIIVSSIALKWVNLGTKELDMTQDWITCKNTYFSKTDLPKEDVDKVLSLITQTVDEFKTAYQESIDVVLDQSDNFAYNFLPLMEKPLIWYRDNDCFVCTDAEYLFRVATEGVYRIIEKYLRESGQKKIRQTHSIVWGDAYETYVNEALKTIFGNDYYENPFDEKAELADGLLDSKKNVYFVETKKTNWSYKSTINGTIPLIDPYLKQLFSDKGIAQIAKTLKKIFQGKCALPLSIDNKLLVPTLVLAHQIPTDTYNRNLYERYTRETNEALFKKQVKPFIMLSVEEIEILEGIASKTSTEHTLSIIEKYADLFDVRTDEGYVIGASALALKDSLYRDGYMEGSNYNNERVLGYFNNLADRVTQKLFKTNL